MSPRQRGIIVSSEPPDRIMRKIDRFFRVFIKIPRAAKVQPFPESFHFHQFSIKINGHQGDNGRIGVFGTVGNRIKNLTFSCRKDTV